MAFAIVAMVCFGAADLFYKRAAAAGIEARHFLMLQAWVFCPAVCLYTLATSTLTLNLAALWGSLAGFVSFVAFYNFAQSLRTGAVSRNAPIFRLNFILTATFAVVLLGEPLTIYKLAGLALSLAAVWLLLGERSGLSQQPAKVGVSSLAQIALATVAMGITNFLYKLGVRGGASPETVMAAQASVFMPLATFIVVVRDRSLRVARAGWVNAPPAAALLAIGFIVLLHGLALGPASTLVPVAQMGFVVTALMGTVLFGETLNVRKIAGLAAALAALGALAVG
jgi:drug/metabolite transporter (DMT)-like permease